MTRFGVNGVGFIVLTVSVLLNFLNILTFAEFLEYSDILLNLCLTVVPAVVLRGDTGCGAAVVPAVVLTVNGYGTGCGTDCDRLWCRLWWLQW